VPLSKLNQAFQIARPVCLSAPGSSTQVPFSKPSVFSKFHFPSDVTFIFWQNSHCYLIVIPYHFWYTLAVTERRGRVVSIPASYSGGSGFKSRPWRPASLTYVFRGFTQSLHRDSVLNQVTAASYKILSNSLFMWPPYHRHYMYSYLKSEQSKLPTNL
jgi:hypothetical protein